MSMINLDLKMGSIRNPIVYPISALVNPELRFNLSFSADTHNSIDRDYYGEWRLNCNINSLTVIFSRGMVLPIYFALFWSK